MFYHDIDVILEFRSNVNNFKLFNDRWTAGNSLGQRLIMEEFLFLEDERVHGVFEVGFGKSTIPIVDNMTTVHDLTEDIDEIFEGNLGGSTSCFHVSVENQVTVS